MGEVYRARDTKLGRDIALKILPETFARDSDRVARFEREARTLASLNHPAIAQIYGLEDGAIVMELVDGEDLSVRIARGPIPLDEALAIARPIVDALEAAHDAGIVHRDLKPANIKFTAHGRIKVLDFGLAKASQTDANSAGFSHSPTMISQSVPGVILGTAAYMSPEQARGKTVDKRTDIWAFGCVLFEMLTGEQLFSGETFSDVIAKIIERQPSLESLPAETPHAIRSLLRRCLKKDPRDRLHEIADARIELEDAIGMPPAGVVTALPTRASSRRPWVGVAAGLLIGVAAMMVVQILRSGPSMPELRFDVSIPPTDYEGMALSPDGMTVAYVELGHGKDQLWLRRLDSSTARPVEGTPGATFPFWSPDGKSIAYFSPHGGLKRVPIDGGAPQTIIDTGEGRGGSWGPDGTIILNKDSAGPIYRVPSTGGEATPVTRVEGGGSDRYPQFLPDGVHFLFYRLGTPETSGVYVGSIKDQSSKRLFGAESEAVYAAPGFLLFARQGNLVAQRFDASTLRVSGEPSNIGEYVGQIGTYTGTIAVSASASGAIAFHTSVGSDSRFVWFDHSGNRTATLGPPGKWYGPALSSDGTDLAAGRFVNGNEDIWLIETDRGVPSKLTSLPSDEEWPVFSPDGSRIIFSSSRKGPFDLYETSANGSGKDDAILESPQTKIPSSWSADGRYILYDAFDPKGTGIWAMPLTGDRKPFAVVARNFVALAGQFSRDTQWIAYQASESGRFEVYVQSFPNGGERRQVSLDGGAAPQWRADGKELYFLALDNTMMAVSISSAAGKITSGKPVPLFKLTNVKTSGGLRPFVVAPDGQRFLVNVPADNYPVPITVIFNWHPPK